MLFVLSSYLAASPSTPSPVSLHRQAVSATNREERIRERVKEGAAIDEGDFVHWLINTMGHLTKTAELVCYQIEPLPLIKTKLSLTLCNQIHCQHLSFHHT
jgi:hypothetical protein